MTAQSSHISATPTAEQYRKMLKCRSYWPLKMQELLASDCCTRMSDSVQIDKHYDGSL